MAALLQGVVDFVVDLNVTRVEEVMGKDINVGPPKLKTKELVVQDQLQEEKLHVNFHFLGLRHQVKSLMFISKFYSRKKSIP